MKTSVTEHCDYRGYEYWDNMSMDLVMTSVMEYFDDKSPGTLCCQGSWSIVMTGVMEHCDEKVMEH